MVEPHWWGKFGTSAYNFNLHTFLPLSVYLCGQKQDISLESTRFLTCDPLPALQNPFAFFGKPLAKPSQVHDNNQLEGPSESEGIMKDYQSPLMQFKSYRLSPNYPIRLTSNTHSHKLDPFSTLCR
jgi:hypothetical protein